MKKIADYLELSQKSERIERKFLMTSYQTMSARRVLIKAGFQFAFRDRIVSSIYYDDINHSALRDNIDGNPYRDKVRLRYYDDDFDNAQLEIKHKRNFHGYKTSLPITGGCNFDELICLGNEWIKNNIFETLQPSSIVSYSRQYYKKFDLRATIDTNVISRRFSTLGGITAPKICYGVVELKYPSELDNKIRGLYSEISRMSIRMTKSSKYANSLL
jgi:hypothetical protein